MSKLLVVVDYQEDFVDGSLGFPGAEKLDLQIAKKIEEHKGKVVYTMDTHTPGYLETREGKALPVPHCVKDTAGWLNYKQTGDEIVRQNAYKNAYCIEKASFGAAPEDMIALRKQLPKKGADIEEIELVGLVTNICVISNAVVFQAAFPEAQIIVDAALCASFDPVLHEKTLDVLEGLQVKVINR